MVFKLSLAYCYYFSFMKSYSNVFFLIDFKADKAFLFKKGAISIIQYTIKATLIDTKAINNITKNDSYMVVLSPKKNIPMSIVNEDVVVAMISALLSTFASYGKIFFVAYIYKYIVIKHNSDYIRLDKE